MDSTTVVEPTVSTTGAATWTFRAVATLSVVMIVVQGVTAGQLLSGSRAADALHFSGAIVVHVLTGLTAVAAVLATRRDRAATWPAVVAAIVFVVGFVQAAVGEAGIIAVHVPLAMLLLIGAAAVLVRALLPARTGRR